MVDDVSEKREVWSMLRSLNELLCRYIMNVIIVVAVLMVLRS